MITRRFALLVGLVLALTIAGGSQPKSDFSLNQIIGFGVGSSGYSVNAVTFDGTNDWLSKSAEFTGLADSKSGIFSCWFNVGGGAGTYRYLSSWVSGANNIYLTTGNVLRFQMANSAPAVVMDMSTAGTFGVSATWHHVLASWDVATGAQHLYIDDVSDKTGTSYSNTTIDYTRGSHATGAWKVTGEGKWNGDLAECYFAPGQFLDFSSAANRRLFIDAAGKPVDLGSDGSAPTGTAPIQFHTGPTATWHTNAGSGGGMTENGALTDASTSPSD